MRESVTQQRRVGGKEGTKRRNKTETDNRGRKENKDETERAKKRE